MTNASGGFIKHCNGSYLREMDKPCPVCGAKPDDDCRAKFSGDHGEQRPQEPKR